jgi:hypothetical protein
MGDVEESLTIKTKKENEQKLKSRIKKYTKKIASALD